MENFLVDNYGIITFIIFSICDIVTTIIGINMIDDRYEIVERNPIVTFILKKFKIVGFIIYKLILIIIISILIFDLQLLAFMFGIVNFIIVLNNIVLILKFKKWSKIDARSKC